MLKLPRWPTLCVRWESAKRTHGAHADQAIARINVISHTPTFDAVFIEAIRLRGRHVGATITTSKSKGVN